MGSLFVGVPPELPVLPEPDPDVPLPPEPEPAVGAGVDVPVPPPEPEPDDPVGSVPPVPPIEGTGVPETVGVLATEVEAGGVCGLPPQLNSNTARQMAAKRDNCL